MNDQLNGSGNPQIQPNPDHIKQVEQLLATISPQIRAVLGTVFRGLMVSTPGVPPHVVLQICCFECGNFAGSALQGDVIELIKLRKSFKDSFEDGISKAKITQAPAAVPANLRG